MNCVLCGIVLGVTNRSGYCSLCRKRNPDYIAKRKAKHAENMKNLEYVEKRKAIRKLANKSYIEKNKDKVAARRKTNRNKWDSTYKRFNLTADKYFDMFTEQGGRCAICGKTQEDDFRKRLSVDHCHKNHVVRGLLCNPCNLMLGHSKDNPATLRSAADYLEKNKFNKAADNTNNDGTKKNQDDAF